MKRPKKIYYVDIPDWPAPEGNWRNVAEFTTKRQAVKFLADTWGIDARYAAQFKHYADLFIVEGER